MSDLIYTDTPSDNNNIYAIQIILREHLALGGHVLPVICIC